MLEARIPRARAVEHEQQEQRGRADRREVRDEVAVAERAAGRAIQREEITRDTVRLQQ